MSEFKKALCIELHDAGVVIDADYADSIHGFHDFATTTAYVNGYMLARLARIFGVETYMVPGYPALGDMGEIELFGHKITYYGADSSGGKIKAIYARVDGRGALSFKIVEDRADSGERTKSYTYSGAYTVEWKQ